MSKTEAKPPATKSKAAPSAQTTIALSAAELEALIRRVVREELRRLLAATKPSILDDWSHEGPEDPGDDEELVQAALEALRELEENPEAAMDLEEFEAELRRAEAAGELPD
jgi:hypothetical protein